MQNPFGDAKPREAVIAERTGKDEAKVLEEEALSYEVHFKLTSEQFAEKKARQEEIEALKASLHTDDVPDAEAVKVCVSACTARASVTSDDRHVPQWRMSCQHCSHLHRLCAWYSHLTYCLSSGRTYTHRQPALQH